MQKTMTSAEIRQSFLDFFKSKQHEIVPSAPLVLPSDPTLMFVNAGMNPFKEIFLGAREPEQTRIADTQKCLRVSGKHNDLEEVGVDTYHHTFFEMLGNWSFGDYYKKEAISWAWELLTDVWGMPKDRLYVTVYKDDDEAAELWKSCTDIDPNQIQRHDEKDNFWEMGETGPCGPCSEIHIDLTEKGGAGHLVNADSPEVMEIWNLVFIQYNRRSDGSLEELPNKHIDTGMGFERLCTVIQGKTSNYDTDVFTPLIDKLKEMSGKDYEGDEAIAMRVIADHIRTLAFAIGDGVMPSNSSRGYILRRILRRAVRYGRSVLGFEKPFLCELLEVLQQNMGDAFPEIIKRDTEIRRAIHAEEESFARTLGRGIQLFEDAAAKVKKSGDSIFPGDEAFKLYDTYGFPLDLTELMASEIGLSVDQGTFDKLMAEQQEKARAARKNVGGANADVVADLVSQNIRSQFSGYTEGRSETTVLAIVKDGNLVDSLTEGEEAEIVLSETPFYAESGGQLGDAGSIDSSNSSFDVADTQKPAEGIILHTGKVTAGSISKGDKVNAAIDTERRVKLQRNHSGTHIMNHALRCLVSNDVKQAGSMVAPDRLRFDFTYPEAIPSDKLEAIERMVNGLIADNGSVDTNEIPMKEVHGSDIVAVFDEKYGDIVRVVNIGGYSKELCGGTHVKSAGEIGSFRILSESSVSAGVRRIEACCGEDATELTLSEHKLVRDLSQALSVKPEDLQGRIEQLQKQNKELEKKLKDQGAKAALSNVDDLVKQVKDVNGIPLLAAEIPGQDTEGLRNLQDVLRQKIGSAVILLGSNNGGKAVFVASVTDDLIAKGQHAGNLIGQVAKIAQGGGGGQPNKAQAGGKDGSKVPEAIAKVPELIQRT